MTVVVAHTAPEYAIVLGDRRVVDEDGIVRDDRQKVFRGRGLFYGVSGVDAGYVALAGESLAGLRRGVRFLHGRLRAWYEQDAAYRQLLTRYPGPEAPRPDDPVYGRIIVVGYRGRVFLLGTCGDERREVTAATLPPGLSPAARRRIEDAAAATGSGWTAAVRALAALAAAVHRESPRWVGPTADIGLIERTTGAMRQARGSTIQLAEMADAELGAAFVAVGQVPLADRLMSPAADGLARWVRDRPGRARMTVQPADGSR